MLHWYIHNYFPTTQPFCNVHTYLDYLYLRQLLATQSLQTFAVFLQKKSRLDSTGEGSGVEIIENRPYKDGPGGSGQYTKKIYHIGNHIPGWLKAIVPKTALQVIEEAWNAYPYTKMKTTCPFVEKFYVDVETKYISDNGSTVCLIIIYTCCFMNQQYYSIFSPFNSK